MNQSKQTAFRSGFVSIIGRPNVGKSCLLNHFTGEKTAIVTNKAQTTRTRIMGVKHLENAQIVFMDTPGIFKPNNKLGRCLVEKAYAAFKDSDIVFFMTDINKDAPAGDKDILQSLKQSGAKHVYLLINKVDTVRNKEKLLSLITQYKELFFFQEIFPISAITGENLDTLLRILLEKLPEGPKFFPDGMITDQPERMIMAEFIREKVFKLTKQEVPYSSAVMVDNVEPGRQEGVSLVDATIYIERDSQKGILIGKKGSMLQKIGTAARLDIEERFGGKVVLNLFVKVKKEWTKDLKSLYDFGYRE